MRRRRPALLPVLPPEGPATVALARTIYRQATEWRAEHDTPDAARLVARAQDWLAVHLLPTHGYHSPLTPDPLLTAVSRGLYTQMALWPEPNPKGGETHE